MATYTITVTVGSAIRRHVRRTLMRHNDIHYTEDRGLLNSLFVIKTSSKPTYDAFTAWFDLLARDNI